MVFFKGKKYQANFGIPMPAQLAAYRKAYNNYDFFGGDLSFTENFNSQAYVHPAQIMDRIAALLMFTNRAAKFNEKQICIISASWAQLMLGLCKEGHYPGYGERYKEKNLPPQLLTGAVYNGVYRALQADYSPNYDVDCLLAEGSINRYILLIFDTFLEDSDNFGRVGDNCLETLQKLRKFFKTRG
ncbi:hypothetical protein [Anaerobiospirillum succiniciproducens]|uniref:hypothetical protein n=1 Tax=Anaerobiospirillum succiniciproducens TaxID=13335 RepID=UPI0005C5A487|nr:hypothetical protein [Anaerobiospirillum succiniciproducens]